MRRIETSNAAVKPRREAARFAGLRMRGVAQALAFCMSVAAACDASGQLIPLAQLAKMEDDDKRPAQKTTAAQDEITRLTRENAELQAKLKATEEEAKNAGERGKPATLAQAAKQAPEKQNAADVRGRMRREAAMAEIIAGYKTDAKRIVEQKDKSGAQRLFLKSFATLDALMDEIKNINGGVKTIKDLQVQLIHARTQDEMVNAIKARREALREAGADIDDALLAFALAAQNSAAPAPARQSGGGDGRVEQAIENKRTEIKRQETLIFESGRMLDELSEYHPYHAYTHDGKTRILYRRRSRNGRNSANVTPPNCAELKKYGNMPIYQILDGGHARGIKAIRDGAQDKRTRLLMELHEMEDAKTEAALKQAAEAKAAYDQDKNEAQREAALAEKLLNAAVAHMIVQQNRLQAERACKLRQVEAVLAAIDDCDMVDDWLKRGLTDAKIAVINAAEDALSHSGL